MSDTDPDPARARGEITEALTAVRRGERGAAEQLLPLVYRELRELAHARMAAEPAGHTLQATALVHEAYLRLVEGGDAGWDSRGHFFAAAAEAMRRILVERARRVRRLKRGGDLARVDYRDDVLPAGATLDEHADEVLAVDRALTRLESLDPRMGEVVKLRFFAGLSNAETAETLASSERSVRRLWTGAKAWLRAEFAAESR